MTQHTLVRSYVDLIDLHKAIDNEEDYLVIDTETDGLLPYQGNSIIGVSVYAPSTDQSFYIANRHRDYDLSKYKHALNEYVVYAQENSAPEELYWPDVCNSNVMPSIFKAFIRALNASEATHVFFNAMFDLHMLWKEGYRPNKIVEDVMLMAHLLNENEHLSNGNRRKGAYRLKRLAHKYLTTEDYNPIEGEETLVAKAKEHGLDPKEEMYRLSPEDVYYYACMDVVLTWQLREFYLLAIKKWNQWELYQQRCEFLQTVLFPMEKNGFPVDLKFAAEREEINNNILEAVDARLPKNVNLNSPKQVKNMFKRQGTIVPSTGFSVLKRLALQGNELAELMMKHRKYSKENSAFFSALPKHVGLDGKVHPSYFATGTNAGRISCGNPNLQQAPKRISYDPSKDSLVKAAFRVPDGWTFVMHDFGQIELRLAAHYAQCKLMIDMFNAGADLHQYTADELSRLLNTSISRFIGKTSNFGLLYGMGGETASNTWLKDDILIDYDDAWKLVNAWNATYPEYRQAKESYKAEVLRGKPAPDGTGNWNYIQLFNDRTRKYHEFKEAEELGIIKPGMYDYEASKAWNNYIQGTAAGVAEVSEIRVARHFKDLDDFLFVIAVHDSIGYMVPTPLVKDVVPVVVDLMTQWDFDVPMIVDTNVSTTSWYDLEPYVA